jgi:hypothetical protein
MSKSVGAENFPHFGGLIMGLTIKEIENVKPWEATADDKWAKGNNPENYAYPDLETVHSAVSRTVEQSAAIVRRRI